MEYSLDVDQNLKIEEPSLLFDRYLNTCPDQGSRTIRTEVKFTLSVVMDVIVDGKMGEKARNAVVLMEKKNIRGYVSIEEITYKEKCV